MRSSLATAKKGGGEYAGKHVAAGAEGGVVDARVIQPIVEVALPPKRKRMPPISGGLFGAPIRASSANSKSDSSNREQGQATRPRGGGAANPSEMNEPSDEVLAVDPEDEALAAHLEDYHPRGMEPAATYLRPMDLKKFASILGTDDWDDVHQRVILLGQARSKKLREHFAKKKASLDEVGIFLPEANKLRVDAQMQVELRRTLQYEELERVVLTEMLVQERLNSASAAERDAAELQANFQAARRKQTATKVEGPGMARQKQGVSDQERGLLAGPESNTEGLPQEEADDGLAAQPCKPALNFEEYKAQIAARRAAVNPEAAEPPPGPHVQARALGGRTNDKLRLRCPRSAQAVGEVLQKSRKPRIAAREQSQRNLEGKEAERHEIRAYFAELDRKEREEAGLPLSGAEEDAEVDPTAEVLARDKGARRRRRTRAAKRQSAVLDPSAAADCALLQQLRAVFEMLEVPPALQMELMIKYSDPAQVMDFMDVVADWERVGKIVVLHEKVVKVVLLARDRKVEASAAFTDDETEALEALGCYVSMAQMFGASCASWAHAILDKIAALCERAVQELEERWHDKISYRGHLFLKTRFPAAARSPPKPEPKDLDQAYENEFNSDLSDIEDSEDARDTSEASSDQASHDAGPAASACTNKSEARELAEIRYGGNRHIVRLNPLLLRD